MKVPVLIFCLLTGFMTAHAQENYEVSLIPKELLPYASAVIRNEQTTVQVESLDNTIVHIKKAITVLNKNGDEDAELSLDYDKSSVIKSAKGLILNEFGKPIAKFTESDFSDESNWDGFSLFLGDKIKSYKPAVTEYPYTVVYEYEIKAIAGFPAVGTGT